MIKVVLFFFQIRNTHYRTDPFRAIVKKPNLKHIMYISINENILIGYAK